MLLLVTIHQQDIPTSRCVPLEPWESHLLHVVLDVCVANVRYNQEYEFICNLYARGKAVNRINVEEITEFK